MANDVTITIKVEGTAEAIAKLGLVGDASKRTANEQSGAWSKINSSILGMLTSIPKVGSAFSGLGSMAGPALLPIAGTLVAILGYLSSVIPELVAAGLGVGAFGALSYPIFAKILAGVKAVQTAVGDTAKDKAWAAIPAALQPAVHTILQIKQAWTEMSESMTPLVGQIASTIGDIVRKLLPLLRPLAVEAGQAIEGLLKQFDKIASSPGFKSFFAEMTRLSGPAITTIGKGLMQIGVQVGQLIKELASPQGLQTLRYTFDAIATAVMILGKALQIAGFEARMWTHGIILAMHYVLDAVKFSVDGILGALAALFGAMSHIPLIGAKWRGVADAIKSAQETVDGALNTAISKTREWDTAFNNAPKVIKLQADISDLQQKLYIARQNLNNPDLTKTRRAAIEANITQLVNALDRARAELASLQSKTIYVNTVYTTTGTPVGGPGGPGHVTGGQTGGIRSGLTWVGERGPELVTLPAGSMVHSAPDSHRIAQQSFGAPTRVELCVTGGGSEFERFMVQFIRKFVAVRAGGDVQVAFGRG